MRSAAVFPLVAGLVMLAGCAPQAGPQSAGKGAGADAGKQCFFISQITSFNPVSPDRVIVNFAQYESWELELAPGCPDVDWTLQIGVDARGRTRVCNGNEIALTVPYPGTGARRCPVRSFRKLSDQEAAAARGQTPRN